MRTGVNQLLFGQHKDPVAAVIKLKPGKRHIRILLHQMYHAVTDFTNQNPVVAGIIRRVEPHFAPAAYVPVGMDATVADDGLDFSFTNPFQHPVCVYTVAGKNTVTTYILGNHADTCSVSFETTHLQNLPHKVIKKHDDSVTEDKRKQEGYDGHDVTIRRTVAYSDGDRHVDTIESHYDPNDEIILTPGDDSEEVVSTADLEPQDPLLNAPHDMMDFNVPAADTADTADEE